MRLHLFSAARTPAPGGLAAPCALAACLPGAADAVVSAQWLARQPHTARAPAAAASASAP